MADLETRVDNLEKRVVHVENKLDVLVQQVQDFIAESRAARAKTDEELKEIRANQAALNQRMDNTLLSIKNLITATIVGIGALSVGVLGFVWTMATK